MDETEAASPTRGYSQQQLLEVIEPALENARVWGAVYSHRQACVRYFRDELWQLLDDPSTTRRRLRPEIEALAKRIEERGPPEEGERT
jgi:hypothetical protein